MTLADDRNELVTTQEKLEWVTPQISLMGAENTEGKNFYYGEIGSPTSGPS